MCTAAVLRSTQPRNVKLSQALGEIGVSKDTGTEWFGSGDRGKHVFGRFQCFSGIPWLQVTAKDARGPEVVLLVVCHLRGYREGAAMGIFPLRSGNSSLVMGFKVLIWRFGTGKFYVTPRHDVLFF